MPQPEHEAAACDWFERAHEDWRDAQVLAAADPGSSNAVWLIQQAVEKAVKSLLVLHQIEFRKIHDLEALRALLPAQYVMKTTPPDLAMLSQRGMESRYPGEYDEIDAADVADALVLGAAVMALLDDEFDPAVRNRIDPSTGQPYTGTP